VSLWLKEIIESDTNKGEGRGSVRRCGHSLYESFFRDIQKVLDSGKAAAANRRVRLLLNPKFTLCPRRLPGDSDRSRHLLLVKADVVAMLPSVFHVSPTVNNGLLPR